MKWLAFTFGAATLVLFLKTYLRIKEIRLDVIMGHLMPNNLKAFTPKGREYLKNKTKYLIFRILMQVAWCLESYDLLKDIGYFYAF